MAPSYLLQSRACRKACSERRFRGWRPVVIGRGERGFVTGVLTGARRMLVAVRRPIYGFQVGHEIGRTIALLRLRLQLLLLLRWQRRRRRRRCDQVRAWHETGRSVGRVEARRVDRGPDEAGRRRRYKFVLNTCIHIHNAQYERNVNIGLFLQRAVFFIYA